MARRIDLGIIVIFHLATLVAGFFLTLGFFFATIGLPLMVCSLLVIVRCGRRIRSSDVPVPGPLLHLVTVELAVLFGGTVLLVALAGLEPANNRVSLVGAALTFITLASARL